MAEPLFTGRKLNSNIAMSSGIPNCSKCGLSKKCETPRIGLIGKGQKGILFITEKPSAQTDRQGSVTLSKAGKYLKTVLKRHKVDLTEDCWRISAINCHTSKTPTPVQVECCRPMVMQAIKNKQPKKIIVLGSSALECVLGHRWNHEQLGKLVRWRGHNIPDRNLRTWMYITFHPSYVQYMDRNKVVANTFKRDIKNALKHKAPNVDWDLDLEKQVRILTDVNEIRKAIKQYRDSGELVSFDYEATGLKLDALGHCIYTVSMATPKLEAVSFPLYPELHGLWKRFLKSQAKKSAHNIKFEHSAGLSALDTETQGWSLCTMQAAHVLDNRKGICSLEFQTYVRLGFMPWGMDMKKYWGKRGKGANSINKIKEAPIRSTLLYGGLDSISQSMLAHLPEYRALWI